MKTHFPNNRKQSIISKWRNGYRNIRSSQRMIYFLRDIIIQKEYKFYIERDKEYRKMILSMISSLVIWMPIAYFTPYEDEFSKILALIISFLLLYYIRKVMTPTLKLNEKGIYFRDLRMKWEEVDKVKINIGKKESLRYKMTMIISNIKGEVLEKSLGMVWRIYNNKKLYPCLQKEIQKTIYKKI